MPGDLPHFCLTLPILLPADSQYRGALIDQELHKLLQPIQVKGAVVSRDVAVRVAQQSFSVFHVHSCRAQPVAERMPQVMDPEPRNTSSDAGLLPRCVERTSYGLSFVGE